jgi:hypothetical protein
MGVTEIVVGYVGIQKALRSRGNKIQRFDVSFKILDIS